MIARLRGHLLAREEGTLVLDVGGIGLTVHAPTPLIASLAVGEQVILHTHLIVRQDALILYGFAAQDELRLFNLLLTVSGVGPRLALGLLSSMSPESLRLAISRDQADLLSRIPGLGPKTARKIIFDLKEKVGMGEGVPEELASLTSADAEVIEALTALGYSIVEAQRAVQSVPRDVTDVEERLRIALSSFASP